MPTIRIEGRVSRIPEGVREKIRDRAVAEVARLREVEPQSITVLWIGTLRGSTPDIVVQVIGTFPVLHKGQAICDALKAIFADLLPDLGGAIRQVKIFCDKQDRQTSRAYAVLSVADTRVPGCHF